MTEPVMKTEDLWSSYKLLRRTTLKFLSGVKEITDGEFENILKKHKQNFYALLQNQPKNAKSREELKKSVSDGIVVRGVTQQVISEELYQEAVILSDMYDLNEFAALDLLCTAQIQRAFHPGVPRGLIAVRLYYEGRNSLLTTLRCLVQARAGVQWSINVSPDIQKFITDYTNQLQEGGLFNCIFDLLRTLDLTQEVEKLQDNLALGGPRHRREIIELFKNIRLVLADIVFIWATQSGLSKAPLGALISYLRQVELNEEPTGCLDAVNLYLLFALFAALDLNVLQQREDSDAMVKALPLLSDPELISFVIAELTSKQKWRCEGLQSVAIFALSVCVSSLRVLPATPHGQEALNQEEALLNTAIEGDIFQFFNSVVLDNEQLYKDEFLAKRMHNLIADFILGFYPKIKELRMKADVVARTVQLYSREGLDAPLHLPRSYENLLKMIAKFYKNETLDPEFILSFWSLGEMGYNSLGGTRGVSLFQFVRLSGDSLPQILFVPYLNMLASLSTSQPAARHCFNMLKQVGGNPTPSLTWDHFFGSFCQYYLNLRREVPSNWDTVYRNNYVKGVSPQELEGLHAVLALIQAVAGHDEFSRLALCEHPSWAPLKSLLGLVGCSIPITLKAELLLTLAALSKSTENATQMWDNLEQAQILVTIPTTSSYVPRGLQTELDEIEARAEEYPLTKAFLKLLDVLTNFGIPRVLGAGQRVPGFDPYLSFIIDSVFVKFPARAYRNAGEKWDVALLCLSLFEKFLLQYDPQPGDFPKKNESGEFNPPPGYHLMVRLNNKTELLTIILDIIDEGARVFDGFPPPSQEFLNACTEKSLNIVQIVLGLQPRFSAALTASSSAVLLTPLSKLILTINRKSGKPDHGINIAKYLTYHPALLQHALIACKILNHINSTPILHNQFFTLFMVSEARDEIRQGFVLSLDSEVQDPAIEKIKTEILKLIKSCLHYSAPNFGHFLLGFDTRRDIAKTEFQFAGVLDSPRGCLHSLVSLIDAESFADESPILESSYELLFLLASNTRSYAPVLRFLRLNKAFFTRGLQVSVARLQQGIGSLKELAYLLKILAVELKVCSELGQITYVKQLTAFLVGLPLGDNIVSDHFNNLVRPLPKNTTEISFSQIASKFLLSLIPYFEFKALDVVQPEWQFFDAKVLNALMESCVPEGGSLIDLKKLHQRLYDEVKLLQGSAVISQIQAIMQEIPKVLKYALELNQNMEKHAGIIQFVKAFSQIAQVLVLYIPAEIIAPDESQILSVCVMLELLRKVLEVGLVPEVGQLLSGTIVMICAHLQRMTETENAVQIQLHDGALKEILQNLISWIMLANVTDELLKINLYSALVALLRLICVTKPQDQTLDQSMYVSRLDGSKHSAGGKHGESFDEVLQVLKLRERLIEVICQDSVGGNQVAKMLALSSFGFLIALSGNMNWILYMSGRGYLKCIIESILESNRDLETLLEPNLRTLKPLYVYMSKMLFLGRIAEARVGAELLLDQKLLPCFINMSVFKYHPEITPSRETETFLPKPEETYLQIWLPTLELCNAILTTLGTDNQAAVQQISYFILSHLDVVEIILRSGSVHLNRLFLKELALLTSVVSRVANNNLVDVLANPGIVHDQRANLYRLQKLTLALLPKFVITESAVKTLTHPNEDYYTFQTSDRLLYALQTVSNLLAYARNVVANHGIDHAGLGALFTPTLKNLGSVEVSAPSFNEQTPSLGVVTQQLLALVAHHQREKFTFDMLKRRLKELPTMTNEELDNFLQESFNLENIVVKRDQVHKLIARKFEQKRLEMQYAGFIIENSLYIIWMHLDYYMLKAIPKVRHFGSGSTTLASSTEATWKVSTDDISNLKHALVLFFNDSFTKQLRETVENQSELEKNFVAMLLEKIIRLIQFVPVK